MLPHRPRYAVHCLLVWPCLCATETWFCHHPIPCTPTAVPHGCGPVLYGPDGKTLPSSPLLRSPAVASHLAIECFGGGLALLCVIAVELYYNQSKFDSTTTAAGMPIFVILLQPFLILNQPRSQPDVPAHAHPCSQLLLLGWLFCCRCCLRCAALSPWCVRR